MFFAAVMYVVLVRFSEDEDIVRDSVRLEEDVTSGKKVPLAKGSVGYVVRRWRSNRLEVCVGTC